VQVFASGRLEAAAHAHRDWIAREVLAVSFDVLPLVDATDDVTPVEVDGDPLAIELVRVER
jgi:hypothetical protein